MSFFWIFLIAVFIEVFLRLVKKERFIDYGYGLKRETNKYIPRAPGVNYILNFRLLGHPTHSPSFNKITTNNVGLRGKTLKLEKPAKEYRIFILGGSSAADHFHGDEQCFTSMLESKLSAATGRDVMIHCACFGGDTLEDGLSMLVHRLVHLSPDMIIFMYGMSEINTILEGKANPLSLHKDQYRKKWLSSFLFGIFTELEIIRGALMIHHKILKPVTTLEFFAGILHNTLHFTRWTKIKTKNPLSNKLEVPNFKKDLDHSLKVYSLMLEVCKSCNIQTVCATSPIKWQKEKAQEAQEDEFYFTKQKTTRAPQHLLYGYYEEYALNIGKICQLKNIPSISVYENFPRGVKYWIDDGHLSTLGIHVLVDEMAEKLTTLIV